MTSVSRRYIPLIKNRLRDRLIGLAESRYSICLNLNIASLCVLTTGDKLHWGDKIHWLTSKLMAYGTINALIMLFNISLKNLYLIYFASLPQTGNTSEHPFLLICIQKHLSVTSNNDI